MQAVTTIVDIAKAARTTHHRASPPTLDGAPIVQ